MGRARAGALAAAERVPVRARRSSSLVLAALVVLALAAAVLVGWWGHQLRRADDDARAAVEEATTHTQQLLSYDSRSLDADLARGRSLVTGDFAAQYAKTAAELIGPTTRAQEITTIAVVVRAALVSAGPDRVETLLYVNQATTSKADPTPRPTTSQIRVTLDRVGDRWLISDLHPV